MFLLVAISDNNNNSSWGIIVEAADARAAIISNLLFPVKILILVAPLITSTHNNTLSTSTKTAPQMKLKI